MRALSLAALLLPLPFVALRSQQRPDSSATRTDTAKVPARSGVLPRVEVRAVRRRNPALRDDGEEATSRSESPSDLLLDPLTQGRLGAILAAVPDFTATANGGYSLLGGPPESNQLTLNGIRMPAGLVTGALRTSVTASPWDVTNGGAAGAAVDLRLAPGGDFTSSWVTARGSAAGIVAGGPVAATGITTPVQLSFVSMGPVGKWQYDVNAFVSREAIRLQRWDASLATGTRLILDSIARITRAPLVRTSAASAQYGLVTRIDLPNRDTSRMKRRYDAFTVALTRSGSDGGTAGTFSTGSLATRSTTDVGALQYESARVLRGAVRLSTNAAVTHVREAFDRTSAAPTVLFSDSSLGAGVVTGGASPQATTWQNAAEARMRATWFSATNARRYLLQWQGRAEDRHVGAIAPHTTFTTATANTLGAGNAFALARTNGGAAARATALILAPATSVAFDVGARGSMLVGLRADAWQVHAATTGGQLRGLDLQPRVSFQQKVGTRSHQRGTFGTLRGGVGRFVDWPSLEAWSPSWSSAGAGATICTGSGVPALSMSAGAPSCISTGTTVALPDLTASTSLRPVSSTRAELTLSVNQLAPKVRAEFGVSAARYDRVAVTRAPFFGRPVQGTLAGEGGRALLVAPSAIGAAGVIPTASDAASTSQLASIGWRRGVQYRVRLATRDPWEPLQLEANYAWNGGRQYGAVVAPFAGSPGLLATMATGNRHTIMTSVGRWIGLTQFRVNVIARSGLRFTPLADRDLNGDGAANDAAFVPADRAQAWAAIAPSSVRTCVLRAAGRAFRPNECEGPWSLTSNAQLTMPGSYVGLPLGTELTLQVSNPTALLARLSDGSRLTFGSSAYVDPRLARITGFDAATQRYSSDALGGFGRAVGLSRTVTEPFRIAVSIRMQLGRPALDKRMETAARLLMKDTTSETRAQAAQNIFPMLPNIPEAFLEWLKGIDLTREQRDQLQRLREQWDAIPKRVVAQVRPDTANEVALQGQLRIARARALDEITQLVVRVRAILTPEQLASLDPSAAMMLNLRVFRWAELSAYPF